MKKTVYFILAALVLLSINVFADSVTNQDTIGYYETYSEASNSEHMMGTVKMHGYNNKLSDNELWCQLQKGNLGSGIIFSEKIVNHDHPAHETEQNLYWDVLSAPSAQYYVSNNPSEAGYDGCIGSTTATNTH